MGVEKRTWNMTDNLLQKLEGKVMTLIAELEAIRKELNLARQENTYLKAARVEDTKKLQNLISLLDTMDVLDTSVMNELDASLQGKENYVAETGTA